MTLMKRIEKARLFLGGEGQVLKSSGAKNDGWFQLDKKIKYPVKSMSVVVKNYIQAALPRPGAGEGRLAPRVLQTWPFSELVKDPRILRLLVHI